MPYFRVTPVFAGEGSAFVEFTVTLDTASTNEIKVTYDTLNAQANYNSSAPDFQRLSGVLTFAPGETSKSLKVNLVNNTTKENTEAFWLELSSSVNAIVAQRLTPALIFDNDATAGTPAIAVTDMVVDETTRTASFAVWLNKPATNTVTVNYSTADGTAIAGQDYEANAGVLSFAAGEVVKTVTVNITNDSLAEADEFFNLLLSNPGNATLVDASGLAQIGRNDAAPVSAPYISAKPIASDESQALASFVIQLSAPSTNEVRVSYSLLNATANYNSSAPDFQSTSGTLIFAPGQTTIVVALPIVDNSTAETAAMMWLDLSSPVNATVPQRLIPAFMFDNDATAGNPGIAVTDVVVDETAGTASFFVWLDKPSVNVVTVNYATADDSAAAGQDFRAASGSLSFAPGEVVKTVMVDILDDGTAELDEFFKLVLSNPSNASIVDSSGLAMIGRSDSAPVSAPHVVAKPIATDEHQPSAGFVVQLSAPSTNEVKVNFSLLNATANYNSSAPDFQSISGTLVFAPGETTRLVTMPVIDNSTVETTGMMWLELSTPVNAIVPQRLTPGLMFDNDTTAGVPGILVSDLVVDESAGTASFFVWLNKPSVNVVTVNYATADDTAIAGQDFRAASGSLSFAPGDIVKTITLDISDDALAEADEFFKLVLSNPNNATIIDASGLGEIGRSDGNATSAPMISAKPIASDESQPFANFVVQLSAPSTNEVKVNYSLLNATANYNSSAPDFQSTSGTLVFAPGQTTLVVTMPVIDNSTIETTASMWLELSTPVNAVLEQRLTPALMFDNDSIAGIPAASVSDVVVDESAGTASFFVWLNKPSVNVVSLGYATADDTAVAGSDYRAASGALSFAPGEVVKTVTVDILNDSLAEGNEFFRLLLSNPSNATIADGSAGALIGRNDFTPAAQPQVLAGPVTVSEGDVLANVVITLSAPSSNEVRVNYSFNNGTANYNSSAPDFQSISGTLVFAPGQTTKVLSAPLIENTSAEGSETFILDLNTPVNATVPQRQTTITILDNDSGATVLSYGMGNDLYTVSSVLDNIAESPNGGIDTVRASVSYTLPENVENLVLTGSALNGIGNTGNNIFRGTSGNNSFDGREGVDTVVFSGGRQLYDISSTGGARIVSGGNDGTDTLFGIERLQFTGSIEASDTSPGGNTYQVYALYHAAFNHFASIEEYSQWVAVLDRNGSINDTAQAMINFYAPGVPDEVLVSYLWSTVIGGAIPADSLATYAGLLASGAFTQGGLFALASTLPQNTIEIAGIVSKTVLLDPAYFPIPG